MKFFLEFLKVLNLNLIYKDLSKKIINLPKINFQPMNSKEDKNTMKACSKREMKKLKNFKKKFHNQRSK